MENDNIKNLFSNFDPQLTSSSLFIDNLKRNLESVEIVKQYSRARRRHNRLAVILAAAGGFIAGIILTLLYPLISEYLCQWSKSWLSISPELEKEMVNYMGWIVIACASIIISLNTYTATLAKLSTRYSPQRN